MTAPIFESGLTLVISAFVIPMVFVEWRRGRRIMAIVGGTLLAGLYIALAGMWVALRLVGP